MLRFSFGLSKMLILFVIAAGALFVLAAIATMPSSATVEARETTKTPVCHTEQVALDEGYGVSRMVERRVCDDL